MRKPLRRSLAVLAAAVTAGSLTTTPASASAATTWLQVSAGNGTTCGVTGTHDLWCWGSNSLGKLGTGDTKRRLVPARIGAKGIWASVSVGLTHTCALDRDGTRYCWGGNEYGKLGYDDTTDRLKPVAADSTWTMLSTGSFHTCGILTNRRAYCWGDDQSGQLGNDGAVSGDQLSPQRVTFDGRWSAISTGPLATCGLDSDGKRYCWGHNAGGVALGLGKSAKRITTPATSGDGTWRSVGMGFSTGCGVSTGRRLYCWGENDDGQLGVGDKEKRSEPTRVSGKDWAQVSVGRSHTCGLKTDGTGYCWGSNSDGQLGVGTNLISTATPHVIGGLGNVPGRTKEDPMTWSSLSVGTNHTCGIRTDGILFCWGRNASGQLGNGTTTNSNSPHEVA